MRSTNKKIKKMLILGCIFLIVTLIMHLLIKPAEPQSSTKKLIEYGWDAPTPEFFRQHIKQMEESPFDGIIIKLDAGKKVFRKTSYPETAFTQNRKDLAATNTYKLTNNFVLMWSTMEKGWDWFNDTDWTTAENNIRNFAKTVKAGRFKGIALDPETYGESPWYYKDQPQHDSKTFEEYQQQVRKRGAQFMRILQTTQPHIEVFTLGLLSWMKGLLAQTTDPIKLRLQLVNDDYGLWPAFVNGMLNAVQSDSDIIDGHEQAYYLYRVAWFDRIREIIRKDARVLVDKVNQAKYDHHVKIGQAVYVDLVLDLFEKPTNSTDDNWYGVRMPHFLSPNQRLQLLEHNTYHGLRTADKYVWIRSENMDWWQNRIPKGAKDVIQSAKAKINKGKLLEFNIDSAIDKALNKCKKIVKRPWCK